MSLSSQFTFNFATPACNIGYCRAGHDSEFLSTLVGGKLVHLQIHSSGLGEHQQAQAGNLIWTREQCVHFGHTCLMAVMALMGTSGIVNIGGAAHLPAEPFCVPTIGPSVIGRPLDSGSSMFG